jgi:hypothetical protein
MNPSLLTLDSNIECRDVEIAQAADIFQSVSKQFEELLYQLVTA